MANIPADWHQKWLQDFMNTIEASVAESEDLMIQADAIKANLTDHDRQMGVEEYIKKAESAAIAFSLELEEVWGFLNVDPEHIGE